MKEPRVTLKDMGRSSAKWELAQAARQGGQREHRLPVSGKRRGWVAACNDIYLLRCCNRQINMFTHSQHPSGSSFSAMGYLTLLSF